MDHVQASYHSRVALHDLGAARKAVCIPNERINESASIDASVRLVPTFRPDSLQRLQLGDRVSAFLLSIARERDREGI